MFFYWPCNLQTFTSNISRPSLKRSKQTFYNNKKVKNTYNELPQSEITASSHIKKVERKREYWPMKKTPQTMKENKQFETVGWRNICVGGFNKVLRSFKFTPAPNGSHVSKQYKWFCHVVFVNLVNYPQPTRLFDNMFYIFSITVTFHNFETYIVYIPKLSNIKIFER